MISNAVFIFITETCPKVHYFVTKQRVKLAKDIPFQAICTVARSRHTIDICWWCVNGNSAHQTFSTHVVAATVSTIPLVRLSGICPEEGLSSSATMSCIFSCSMAIKVKYLWLEVQEHIVTIVLHGKRYRHGWPWNYVNDNNLVTFTNVHISFLLKLLADHTEPCSAPVTSIG